MILTISYVIFFITIIAIITHSTLIGKRKHKYFGSHLIDGFTTQSINDYLEIQETINPHSVFDTKVMETQATQRELDDFLRNGSWYWSQETIDKYKDAIKRNPYVRTNAEASVNYARRIYNEEAIKQVLNMQSKEGQLRLKGIYVDNAEPDYNVLPNGVGDFAYNGGLVPEWAKQDKIQCTGSTLERISKSKKTQMQLDELSKYIPGFKFLRGECNPCETNCEYTYD